VIWVNPLSFQFIHQIRQVSKNALLPISFQNILHLSSLIPELDSKVAARLMTTIQLEC